MADTTQPLPRNHASQVGVLAHHMIATRDLSALSPLVDALNERSRYEEAREIQRAFAGVAKDAAGMHGYAGEPSVPLSWDTFGTKVERLLWWDIYKWDAGVGVVAAAIEKATKEGKWVEVGETDEVMYPSLETVDQGYATPPMRASVTVDVSNLAIEELRELRNMISQQYGVPTYAYDPSYSGDGRTDDGDSENGEDIDTDIDTGEEAPGADSTDLYTENPPDAER